MQTKCERCGKFRKSGDCRYIWHGDPTYYNSGEVMECRWCMSPWDRQRFEDDQ